MPICIYALTDPDTDAIRYIGKTVQSPRDRLMQHIKHARDGKLTHLCCWLRKLLDAGTMPGIVILEELSAESDWRERERFWIATSKESGWSLTNGTEGGEGITNPSPELRQQRSERMKGNHYADGNRNAAGKRSEEFRQRAAEIARMTRNQVGHVVSPEARKVISDKLMGHESVKGEQNGHARLTEIQVRAIRAMYATGKASYAMIASRYDVTRSCIGQIVRQQTWRHV